ncbi:hypothetical protein BDV96DRAFT_640193 [Lophiotrema nucula]|uniref:RING-type domain-containing protein n=1 Tax=Lophiotrema nucula TaxID=690887 RepID=A0A6A5ZUX0_9PLEO|nr:hypothetical protein BDV96DRAFT_640193 [Lophiotrema nucula]
MAPTHNRVGVKKRRAIKHGRKVARVQIGTSHEEFTIHEDLLCAESLYFKSKLQDKRKDIEGDCPICHEPLQPGVLEITFCSSSCGANVHYECMRSWIETKTAANVVVTCPMCRSWWVSSIKPKLLRCPELAVKPFEIYVEWLYHKIISVEESQEEAEKDQLNKDLVQAYILGVKVEDRSFRNAAIHAMAEVARDVKTYPALGTIELVYQETRAGSGIRKLVVAMWAIAARRDWLKDADTGDWKDLPEEFTRDLALAFIRKRKARDTWDLDAVKAGNEEKEGSEDSESDMGSESESDDDDDSDSSNAPENESLPTPPRGPNSPEAVLP